MTHGAELGHFEAWLSRKPYHQIGSRHDDTQILLHRKGLRDTVSQAHQVPLDWQFGAESNGVIDQLAQSIESLYYGGPLIEEVEACSDDECLLDSEDIDFEFVYALHTFVATVEGQANATKGDTMVLLDDSNSYWWLVRVVKDSSIGRFAPSFVLIKCLCANRAMIQAIYQLSTSKRQQNDSHD